MKLAAVAALLVAGPVVAATYVGNQACQTCHRSIYDSYSRTPMARSTGAVTVTVPGTYRHRPGAVTYRIDAQGQVRFGEVRKSLTWYIGSGAAGQSFVYSYDGFLYQAPVTWYSERAVWNASPGYDRDRDLRWNRPVDANCLFCHASQIRPIYGTENRFADPPFGQGGVGCERCHGPGSEHIQGKASMVNPAKLDAIRRDAVCSQCHLSGEARVERKNKSIATYRPGERLSDYVSYFVRENRVRNAVRATGYVEALQTSTCKRASGDRLWCGTCHNPHDVPARAEAVAYYRAKCLECHTEAQCNRGPDCRTCHMPRTRAADGGHGVLTDHGIARRYTGTPESPMDWKLRPFAGYEGSARELGLAYAETGVRTASAEQMKEAVRLLSAVPTDPEVLTRLADLYLRAGDTKTAYKLSQRAALENAPPLSILVNLGVLEAGQGNIASAVDLWRKALSRNPGLAEAAVNLQRALGGRNGNAEVVQQIEKARQLEAGLQPK